MRRAFAFSVVAIVACSPAPSPIAPSPSVSAVPGAAASSSLPEQAAADRDGDGVPDAVDSCPSEAEDCDGFEDDDGCPDLDDDGDGIADTCDRCPREPGEPPDGCRRVRIQGNEIRVLVFVEFPRGSAEPKPESLPILDEVARALADHPEIERIEVSGHATKDEPNARALAEKRAKRARELVIARGIAPERIVIRVAGTDEPIADPKTEAGRARNRRVAWKIVSRREVPRPPTPVGPARRAEKPTCPGLDAVPPPVAPPPGGCPRP